MPHPSSRDEMRSAEFAEKLKAGPVVLMTVMPSGPTPMGTNCALWFLYLIPSGLRRPGRRSRAPRGCAVSSRIPAGGGHCVPRLFRSALADFDLVPARLVDDYQGDGRRLHLPACARRHLRLALAAIERGRLRLTVFAPATGGPARQRAVWEWDRRQDPSLAAGVDCARPRPRPSRVPPRRRTQTDTHR